MDYESRRAHQAFHEDKIERTSFDLINDDAHNVAMDRLDHLEKRGDIIDDRLSRIEGDVATLKERLADVQISLARLSGKLENGNALSFVERIRSDFYKWLATIIAIVGAIYFGTS